MRGCVGNDAASFGLWQRLGCAGVVNSGAWIAKKGGVAGSVAGCAMLATSSLIVINPKCYAIVGCVMIKVVSLSLSVV